MSSSLPLDYVQLLPENCVIQDMSDTAILDMLFNMTSHYEQTFNYLNRSNSRRDQQKAIDHSKALAEITRIILQDRKYDYQGIKYLQEMLKEEA